MEFKPLLPLFLIFSILIGSSMTMGCLDFTIDTMEYRPSLGITFHKIGGDFEQVPEHLAYLQPEVIRYDLSWRSSYHGEGDVKTEYVAEMINMTHEYNKLGYEQVVVMWQPPEWAEQYDMQTYTQLYMDFLDLYLPYITVDVVQIANEPNHAFHSGYLVKHLSDNPYFIYTASAYAKEIAPQFDTCVNIITILGWSAYMDLLFEDHYEQSYVDIVAIDVYPGTWEKGGNPWTDVRRYLNKLETKDYRGYHGAIMETGYSTPKLEVNAEGNQQKFFEQAYKDLIDILTGYNQKTTSDSYIDYCVAYALENDDEQPYNPEKNFGLLVYSKESGEVTYIKPAYYELADIFQDYYPTILGSMARLPFYGAGLSYTVFGLWLTFLIISNYFIAWLVYPISKPERDFFSKEDGFDELKKRNKVSIVYTAAVSVPLIIMSLLPTQSIFLSLLIPVFAYWFTDKSRVYVAMSLVSMTLVALAYITLSLWGYFII